MYRCNLGVSGNRLSFPLRFTVMDRAAVCSTSIFTFLFANL
jgi:hypothetical protein